MKALFSRDLNTALARLKRLHEENLVREEELKSELEKAKEERNATLVKAKEEAARIIKETKDKADKLSTETQEQARQQAKDILERHKEELRRLENDLADKYQEHALDLSLQMFNFTFFEKGKDALQHDLINEFINEVKSLPQDKFTVKERKIKVNSACYLTADEKARLAQILGDKLAQAVEIEETIDEQLIAGMIIQIGVLVIDGSIRNKLRKVIPYLKSVK